MHAKVKIISYNSDHFLAQSILRRHCKFLCNLFHVAREFV